jgi:pimeloyl-ACP methyl ester carboxylesterase
LLNPFPLHRGVWADTARGFVAAGYGILTGDYPGLGDGVPESGLALGAPALSIDRIAEEIQTELVDRSIPPVVVLGVSMGGYVALALAARFPERLAGLVLVDTRATADAPAARAGRAAALATLQGPAAPAPTAGPGARIDPRVDSYLRGSLPKLLAAGASAALHDRVRALAVEAADGLVAGIVALRDRPDRSADLPALRLPTLVLGGSDDQIVPVAEMQAMARAIPGARFEEIAGAGHLPNLEQPARFEALVRGFMAGFARRDRGDRAVVDAGSRGGPS